MTSRRSSLEEPLAYYPASEIYSRVDPTLAVFEVENALRSGLDVEGDIPRVPVPLESGEFLLMPAELGGSAGIKVTTVAPDNTSRSLPKIQGLFLLFDSETLAPRAVLDGAALTSIRTPAVSGVAAKHLLASDPQGPKSQIDHLFVIGSGPQAESHIKTFHAIFSVLRTTVRARSQERLRVMRDRLADRAAITVNIDASRETPDADVIVCATSSLTPVLESARDDAVIIAIGAHGPDARELGSELVKRSDIVVESRRAALRESGNILHAGPVSDWEGKLVNISELVNHGIPRTPGRPAVFSGVGMSWEDLVIGSLIASHPDTGPVL